MTDTTFAPGAFAGARPSSALYRAVWRWHFYAGLLILPIMVLMAVTGGIYLFKDEINDALYPEMRKVAVQTSAALPPSAIAAAALAAHPGTLKSYSPPAAPDRAAEVKILGEDGLKDTLYVNPYSGAVLGSFWDSGPAGSPPMYMVRKLHSLNLVGWWGNRLVEMAAGWMILLVGTGIYLWWPRGRNVGVLKPRATRGRPLWRDLHAVTGLYTASFILFLAFSGLPWSGFWGKQFYNLTYAVGLGMPDGYWSNYPTSDKPVGEAIDRTPWIMEHQPMPVSGAASGVPAGLDQIVATVEEAGMHPGYALNMPGGETGVFTASVYPDDITQERVMHLDQYNGKVLFDMGLAELGSFGRAAEWGVSIHMGQAFGLANQLVLLLACVAMVLMAVSAAVMWWKRRPAGRLGAPSVPSDFRIPRGVLVIAVVAGVLFPLVGLSLLVIAALELVLYALRRMKAA